MSKGKISIKVGFDGSCPQSKEAIKQEDNTTFTILPSQRKEEGISEEEKGKGFRLGFEIDNRSNQSEEITLSIDWEDEERVYMKYRDIAVDAFNSGKSVYCEKPMALTSGREIC